jgi:hypothetical protein
MLWIPPCRVIDLFGVLEYVPLLQHASHVLFVVEKGNDDLPKSN